jgi:hypothetical protein
MTQYLRTLGALLLAALMTACGGGGGSAGVTAGGSTPTTATPTMALSLVDASGAPTTTVGNSASVFARALVQDGKGNPVAGQVVTFTGNSALIRFLPTTGSALTGANGIALIQVLPTDENSAGAGSLTASTTIGTQVLTGATSFQIPQGVVDPATAKVTDFILLLDKSTLPNTATSTAKLTVIALDSGDNIVAGAKVAVTTDASTTFTPSGTSTDASGQYTGTIGIGSNKTDRLVTVTVTINGIVKKTTLQIAGSHMSITVTPSVLLPGGFSTATVRITDAASVPISGKSVTFATAIESLNNVQATTDANGSVVVPFVAPTDAGSYTIKASGSGIIGQLTVQVGSAASIPAAIIPSGATPSLSAIPTVVGTNTAGSTSNQTQLRLLFVDSNNQPVKNVRVQFGITSTGLGSFDSTISTSGTTVYTDASGVATAVFIPGQTGSPTDGVVVKACYQASDFTSAPDFTAATPCPTSVDVHLTVAAQAVAVSIGDDNVINSADGIYTVKYTVTVADAAGRPVPNLPVSISLNITHYGKGDFAQAITFPLDVASQNTYVPNRTTTPAAFGARVSCINEDVNRNGVFDAADAAAWDGAVNSFGQPILKPAAADILLSYVDPAVTTTDAHGVLHIQVQYSQRYATWLAYRIRATASVSGSQGSAERAFVTAAAENDIPNGSFLLPPYGTGACNQPN